MRDPDENLLGEVLLEKGTHTGSYPGRVLRSPAAGTILDGDQQCLDGLGVVADRGFCFGR